MTASDPVFAALLNRTCSVERYAGAGAAGPVYDPPVVEPCRLENELTLVRDDNGAEVTSSGRLFLRAAAAIVAESRVTLDDGRITTAITVARLDDEHEPHHLEVRLR